MNLSNIFSAVAYKRLAQVDLPRDETRHNGRSNQHEINGVVALRDFFRTTEKVVAETHWYYFADGVEPITAEGAITFYDARANNPRRAAEWRGYYTGDFLGHASSGDVLVLVRDVHGIVYALVFQQDSGWWRAARSLFGFDEEASAGFILFDETALRERALDFLQQRILDELGIEYAVPVIASDEEVVVRKFGEMFPTTKEMSKLARSLVDDDGMQDDERLVRWIEREEALFFALERLIVGKRLVAGFTSVEDFITYSMSVQNRRKSRMGHALENHLEAIFVLDGLRFSKGARTEGKNKPDFLFPGATEYHDQAFDADLLTMLGAKSTLKDRWRQVLTEAKRIPHKHLCTLETAISVDQTTEIASSGLTLVVPVELQATYTDHQQQRLMSLSEFVSVVRSRQRT